MRWYKYTVELYKASGDFHKNEVLLEFKATAVTVG